MKNWRKCGTTRIWSVLYELFWHLPAGSDYYSWSHINTLKCLSNVHCAFIFESFYQSVIEFYFLSLPHTWFCRHLPPHQCLDYPAVQYTRYSNFSLYLYFPILYNSPPVRQNNSWCGKFWSTYSTVLPI